MDVAEDTQLHLVVGDRGWKRGQVGRRNDSGSGLRGVGALRFVWARRVGAHRDLVRDLGAAVWHAALGRGDRNRCQRHHRPAGGIVHALVAEDLSRAPVAVDVPRHRLL